MLKKETTEYNPVENRSKTEIKSNRKYDIIVFGASGFTGQFVAMEMANLSQKYNLTWAIAGRNLNKLQKVLDNVYNSFSKLFYRLLFYNLNSR